MFEASTAREKSHFYRTFDQECESVFERINEFCMLGRFSAMMTVKDKHIEQLFETLESFGYAVTAMPKFNTEDQNQTIRITWDK